MSLIDVSQAGASTANASSRPQSPSVVGPGGHRQSWLWEMERAQVTGWFQPFNDFVSPSDNGKLAVFAPLAQRENRNAANSQQPQEQRTASRQANVESDTSVGQGLSVASSFEVVRPDGDPVSSLRVFTTNEEVAPGPEESAPEAIAASDVTTSAAIPLPSIGARDLAPQGELLRVNDTKEVLVRSPVAPFVPVASQFALLQSAVLVSSSVHELAVSDPPAVPGHDMGETDGPLNSAHVVRTVMAGQPSTRLHSVWTAEGLNLWLGMDGSAQQVTAQASLIASTLQHMLKSHGQRLNRIVCNGSVVFDARTTPATTFRDSFAEVERKVLDWPSFSSANFLSQKETS